MNMYEEMDKETKEMLLDTLAELTLSGKQQWEKLDYIPISFIEEPDNYGELAGTEKVEAFISQSFEMEGAFNGRRYSLELMEEIDFPSKKGNISGILTYGGEQRGKYDFALSFDNRYEDAPADCLKELFADSTAVKLAEAVVSLFEGTEAVEEGFSYAYFVVQDVGRKWKRMPLVKLGEKLMKEKRIADFHRIVLDMEYREKLQEEV
ncbi:MAG: hypothetical protein ACLU9Q_13720 [Marvinbryantia sp.]|uniref:hypothetical protein n=1 Tax=Marvinbryantia sp. TaxID=2496532 RepID=UPI0039999AB5